MRAWHIDAYDARAGIAFASHREADLGAEVQTLDVLAVQVGPPDFHARAVVSRSTGLSATRAAFQTGLFVDEQEVGFPTLDALVAFVQRAYVASGGGDGTAGGGVPPVPPDAPADGGGSPDRIEESRPVGRASSAVEQAFTAVANAAQPLQLHRPAAPVSDEGLVMTEVAKPGYADPAQDEEPDDASPKQVYDEAALAADAALAIGAELVLRCPPVGGPPALTDLWSQAAHSFDVAVARLNLWPQENRWVAHAELARAGRWFLDKRKDRFGPAIQTDHAKELLSRTKEVHFAAFALFLLHGWESDLHEPYFWLDRIVNDRRPWHWRLPAHVEPTDKFDDLASWPLPQMIRKKRDLGNAVSVADFLSLAAGAAPFLKELDEIEHGVLLFAAAHLVTVDSHARRWPTTSNFVAESHAAIFEQASTWFVSQMPKVVFASALEQAIFDAAKCRYA